MAGCGPFQTVKHWFLWIFVLFASNRLPRWSSKRWEQWEQWEQATRSQQRRGFPRVYVVPTLSSLSGNSGNILPSARSCFRACQPRREKAPRARSPRSGSCLHHACPCQTRRRKRPRRPTFRPRWRPIRPAPVASTSPGCCTAHGGRLAACTGRPIRRPGLDLNQDAGARRGRVNTA